ncbi:MULTISPECIES: DUF4860 domain-containing protein [unclassified Butyrivibrio]|uniref:DUF4860 domain-containing protein n=1 Tax=unclassified Butyrivibrio TaxID=2639466 RepID=UPI0003B63832|nr:MULTISPECIES: DUF4860 domain-containing protein [unclassified Butyrivibrio]SDB29324.1 protein of unknown function [Butyrivibrio sp. INlla16]SEM07627.1 protein of unknown function [Butyrivibrio sp. ob235]
MKKQFESRHTVDMLFVIALLFLFAMGALMLIALGSSIYKRSVTTLAENYDRRTAYAYITEKLRQYDTEGNISTDIFNKSGALRIDTTIGTVDYVTYLYEYEGSLMELFSRADAGTLLPESGQRIMDINNLEITSKGEGLLQITITLTDGKDLTFITSKRSGTGANG